MPRTRAARCRNPAKVSRKFAGRCRNLAKVSRTFAARCRSPAKVPRKSAGRFRNPATPSCKKKAHVHAKVTACLNKTLKQAASTKNTLKKINYGFIQQPAQRYDINLYLQMFLCFFCFGAFFFPDGCAALPMTGRAVRHCERSEAIRILTARHCCERSNPESPYFLKPP